MTLLLIALTWIAGTPLPVARDHHVTFAVGGHLYVAGGNTYPTLLDDVWHAAVQSDGSLGAWQAGPALPAARGGHAVAVTPGAVLIIGGKFAGNRNTPEVLVAPIRPDGSLGAWTTGAPLPGKRFHLGAATDGENVWVTGGLDSAVSVASVFTTRIGRDGTVGEWRTLPDLPGPRSHHATLVHGGALYVIAGLDGNPAGANTPLRDILRAVINPDGTLGPWQPAGNLVAALAVHAAFVHEGYMYVVGGVEDNARFVATVQRAPIDSFGRAGAWELMDSLPVARGHVHQTPVIGGRVYSAGGSASRVVMAAVHIGDLP